MACMVITIVMGERGQVWSGRRVQLRSRQSYGMKSSTQHEPMSRGEASRNLLWVCKL
jgi:hypothetical protein